MSSRTPTECVDLATDRDAPADARTEAIQELKRANECDELAVMVRSDDLEEQFRLESLHALATPQCDSTLSKLGGDEALDEDLRAKASELLEDFEGR